MKRIAPRHDGRHARRRCWRLHVDVVEDDGARRHRVHDRRLAARGAVHAERVATQSIDADQDHVAAPKRLARRHLRRECGRTRGLREPGRHVGEAVSENPAEDTLTFDERGGDVGACQRDDEHEPRRRRRTWRRSGAQPAIWRRRAAHELVSRRVAPKLRPQTRRRLRRGPRRDRSERGRSQLSSAVVTAATSAKANTESRRARIGVAHRAAADATALPATMPTAEQPTKSRGKSQSLVEGDSTRLSMRRKISQAARAASSDAQHHAEACRRRFEPRFRSWADYFVLA